MLQVGYNCLDLLFETVHHGMYANHVIVDIVPEFTPEVQMWNSFKIQDYNSGNWPDS